MWFSILVFFLATLGFLAAGWGVPRLMQRDRQTVRRRLAEAFGADGATASTTPLFNEFDVYNMGPAEEYALLRAGNGPVVAKPRPGLITVINHQLEDANLSFGAVQFLLAGVVMAAGLASAGGWAFQWPGVAAGVLAGLIIPWAFVQFKQRQRRERLLNQLPAAFELMARIIRAGQSVPQAFGAVAESFDNPLAGEFANARHQQELGLSAEVVIRELGHRSGVMELRIFSMAMLLQQQTGGNLSEVLDRLAALIRTRLRLRQQVRTLTAEGRLQGITLAVLPALMFVALYLANRRYAQMLLDRPSLLLATGALVCIGLLWIRKIVRFDG
ncbi:type II secretion system F family protein [Zavarzinella formosa]|uniref:type II secretion system F family protein n=1 Tax=Zavarzinella formosa TaxID=360055 RepID=UPI00030833D8|nr:type II secretion system F family protein [Zavarzinella formosa]